MADDAVVHIGENSPEYVAYRLMEKIFAFEQKSQLTRADILKTYAECLVTVFAPSKLGR